MDDIQTFVVTSEHNGIRIDRALIALGSNLSRTQIQRLIEDGDVLINDSEVKASYKVKENDVITIFNQDAPSMDVEPKNIPLNIVFEDQDLVVINKPMNMVVHPAAGHYDDTLVNALLYHFQQLSHKDESIRPGIVHRIDKDTSGLIMVAKNDYAHEKLAEQLKAKTASRRYLALVKGEIPHQEGTIKAPIGRSKSDRKRMAVVAEGKQAVTHFKVLERFPGFTFIECLLETGRTHQIRVHLHYIKYPIVGDAIYGGKQQYGFAGQLLHAAGLTFIHPTSGQVMQLEAPLPDYFQDALTRLRTQGSL